MSRSLVFVVAVYLLFLAACDEPDVSQANATRAQQLAEKVSTPVILTRGQALDLAARSNCLLCHKIEYKLVGPAWKNVAAKYKGEANAANTVASHITTGGSFGWNFGTMPPRGGSVISDANIASLARFIVSLK